MKVVQLVSANPEAGSIEAELRRALLEYREEIAQVGRTFTFEQKTLGGFNTWLQTVHHDTGKSLAAMGPYRRELIVTMLEERFQDVGDSSLSVQILPPDDDHPNPPVYDVTRIHEESLIIYKLFPKQR